VHSASKLPSSLEIVDRLLDPFEVVREPPENLRPEDDELFRHEYRRSFGATDLYRLRGVDLTADGAFIRNGRVVPELRHAADATLHMGMWYVTRRTLTAPRQRFDDPGERYVSAFNRWSGRNYFHWMCDVLPRVYLAREVVDGATFVLPGNHTGRFIEASLAPFRPARIVYFQPWKIARFDEVLVPGHVAVSGNYHEETIRAMARLLTSAYGSPGGESGRRVYVTRRKAGFRYVRNEDEVVEVVRRYGFEVVANEDLSFRDQVALYSRVRFLVGIIGANLTNVMFMEPGGALLQLTRTEDAHNHLYYSLAAAKNVRFYYQHAHHVDTRPGDYWNLTVDLVPFEQTIQRMVEEGK
jgi:hypothetical protein